MSFDEFQSRDPFSLSQKENEQLLTKRLLELTIKHRNSCEEYRNILNALDFDETLYSHYQDLPFLPVRLFKELNLKSVSDQNIVKTITSSGTTGQRVSKIYLDRDTATNQQKAMVKIVADFIGSLRMPMLIIDCPSVISNREMFSARGAGILGFSIFGSKKFYALNDDLTLNKEVLKEFLDQYQNKPFLIFGFTFMIWQHFYKELIHLKESGIFFDLSKGFLIHGGGWKKLQSQKVSSQDFHDRLEKVCGLDYIHDYYGMAEQTGCIYMQCEYGHLHASIFSDVITRDPVDFTPCKIGQRGIIQVVSAIPESYPGHSLLTEDEGIIDGVDCCPCGRKGKFFRILGRLSNAEIRGCSDTYAAKF